MILRLLALLTFAFLAASLFTGCARKLLTSAQVVALPDDQLLYELTQAVRARQIDGGRDIPGRSMELLDLRTEYLDRKYPQSAQTEQDREARRVKQGATLDLPIYRGMHFYHLIAAMGEPFQSSRGVSGSGVSAVYHYKYFPNINWSTDVYILNNRVTSWYSY